MRHKAHKASCATLLGAAIALSGFAMPAQALEPAVDVTPGTVSCDGGEAKVDVAIRTHDTPATVTLELGWVGEDDWEQVGQWSLAARQEVVRTVDLPVSDTDFFLRDNTGAHTYRYAPACDAGPRFTDVGAANQFFMEIEWAADYPITTGYEEDRTFRPVIPIDRNAMAAFLYRLQGSPEVEDAEPEFTDVKPGDPFYKEIQWLAATGITTGYEEDDTFRPFQPVSREAMAAYLFRMYEENGFETWRADDAGFTDISGSPFRSEINWLAETGITTGWPDGTYRPLDPVNRDAMAAFLMRFYGLSQLTQSEQDAER